MWNKIKNEREKSKAHSVLLKNSSAYQNAYKNNDIKRMEQLRNDYVSVKLRDVQPKDYLSSGYIVGDEGLSNEWMFEPTIKIVPSLQSIKYYGHLYKSSKEVTFRTLIWSLVARDIYPKWLQEHSHFASVFVDFLNVRLKQHFECWYEGDENNKKPSEAWYYEECLFLFCRIDSGFSCLDERPHVQYAIRSADYVSFQDWSDKYTNFDYLYNRHKKGIL